VIKPWPRPDLTLGGPPARVALLVLTDERAPDPLPISRRTHGIPAVESALAAQLCARPRAEHAAWWEGLAGSGLLELVAEDLGPDARAAAAAAAHAYEVTVELADPLDLGYLQAAWAIVTCLAQLARARAVPCVVIDPLAGRAWDGAAIAGLRPDRGFDGPREVSVVVDDGRTDDAGAPLATPRAPAAFTRGMAKLGRADLVIGDLAEDVVADAANVLRMLIDAAARGELLEAGDRLELADGRSYRAAPLEAAACARLGLDDDALALVAA
jgi:hypothetical protein